MVGETTGKQRIRTIDFFKGFAIFAIVAIHVVTLHPREVVLDVKTNPLIEFLYAGIMTFFLVSGYFYRPKPWNAVIYRVVKLLVAVVLSILVCTTLLYGYFGLIGQGITSDLYVQTLIDQLTGGVPLFQTPSPWGAQPTSSCFIAVGYYFLWSFAAAYLLFHALAKTAMEDDNRLAIIVAILIAVTVLYFAYINITLPFFLQLVPMEVAFMLIGARMGKMKYVEKMESDWKDKRTLLTVAISLICAVILIFLFPTGTRFNSSYFGAYGGLSAIPFFLICFFCSIVLLYLCSLVVRIRYFSDLFVYIGKYTLQILLVSMFMMKFISAPFFEMPQTFSLPAYTPLQCIIVIAVSIALSIIATHVVKYIMEAIKGMNKKPDVQ